jgi:hypothetical protein
MRIKILILGLICLFFISGCQKVPTTPDITGIKFPAPYNLTATIISSSGIDLKWKNGTGYNTIEIYRREKLKGFYSVCRLYDTIWGHNESWEDINCMPETEYCYKLKGRYMHGPVGVSDYSNEVCGTTPTP